MPTTPPFAASTNGTMGVHAPVRFPAGPAMSPAPESAASAYIGTIAYSGPSGTAREGVTLIDTLGRPAGYETVRGARIAAHHLTVGANRPSAAVLRDVDGRYRVYAVQARGFAGPPHPLAFEHGMPRLPTGAQLDGWLYGADTDVIELRDGRRQVFRYPG
jgi:hypothetical protein